MILSWHDSKSRVSSIGPCTTDKFITFPWFSSAGFGGRARLIVIYGERRSGNISRATCHAAEKVRAGVSWDMWVYALLYVCASTFTNTFF